MKTTRDRLEDLLGTLTRREEAFIEWYFLGTKTLTEIAAEFGISKGRGAQIKDDALRKLRNPVRQKYLRDEITLDQLWHSP